ncbi:MAG: PAS domain S-box protein [Alphaproteobacteria bacterium]|nr:PAS domain S-box protein [Alphaproteobacteria bacterium]MCW5743999.1 PAS domain S-box protein [Alphaproteobacteria bacterium]
MSASREELANDHLGAIGRRGVALAALAVVLLALAAGTASGTLPLLPADNGTWIAMGASAVLLFAFGSTTAANRRRWLAAERAQKEAVESRQQLLEAIEAIPVGFGLYGRDGRMVMFNSRLAAVNPAVYKPDIIGLHYEEIIDRLVAWRPAELGDREDVRNLLLTRFRAQNPGHTQRVPDGRYVDSNEIHTASGYIASCRVDITALKQREAELEASEARYRHVVDSMLDAVFTTDAAGVSYVSPAAERVLGLAPEQIVGVSPTRLFHPDDVPAMIEGLRAAQRAPGTMQALRIRAGGLLPTGHWLDLRFKTTGAPDADGRYALIGVVRDIEAQVRLEQSQRDDMLKLRSIVESSGALIALVNSHRRIVLANRSFIEAAGKPLEHVIGQRYTDVVDCDADARALAAWFAGEQRESFAFDQVVRSGAGRRVVRVTASHVHDEDRDIDYSLFLGVDETQRRSAEVRALDASRLATLGEMATGIAHEINQPLTVVQFGVDALAADIEDGLHKDDAEGYAEDALRHITRVRNQAQRAAAIVRRLQGFARKGDEQAQPFDIAEAVAGAVDLVSEQMRLARIAVDLELPADLPAVHGHANRLQQVVINLMINARDAINEERARNGGKIEQAHIDIRARHDVQSGRLVVEVGDSGPGIPEHVLPRLFESFFTTKPKGKGTGLGLSISTEIMGEMQGTIAAANRPERGAVFRLDLPALTRDLSRAA